MVMRSAAYNLIKKKNIRMQVGDLEPRNEKMCLVFLSFYTTVTYLILGKFVMHRSLILFHVPVYCFWGHPWRNCTSVSR